MLCYIMLCHVISCYVIGHRLWAVTPEPIKLLQVTQFALVFSWSSILCSLRCMRLRTRFISTWYSWQDLVRERFTAIDPDIKPIPVLNYLRNLLWNPATKWRHNSTYSWPRRQRELGSKCHVPAALPDRDPVPTEWDPDSGKCMEEKSLHCRETNPRPPSDILYLCRLSIGLSI
jgi:hypothetical protein